MAQRVGTGTPPWAVACSGAGVVLMAYWTLGHSSRIAVPSAQGEIGLYGLGWLWSLATFGSAAQSFAVALLGLLMFPALSNWSSISKVQRAEAGVSACSSEQRAVKSFVIQLDDIHDARAAGPRLPGLPGLVRGLRRALSEGRARARQLYRGGQLAGQVPQLSRRRSFGSRSSKSEDVLLPRLSAEDSGRGRLLGLARASRFVPSMSRITSGMCLDEMVRSETSYSSAMSSRRMELLTYNGFGAVECLGHDTTPSTMRPITEVITDTHLLQFGALIGEASAQLALSQAKSPGAIGGEPGCFFGSYDNTQQYRQGWELLVEEHKPHLHYWCWRRHLRRGLFMYKSKTVHEHITTAQALAHTFDSVERMSWDEGSTALAAIAAPGGTMDPETAKACASGQSCYMYARTKFPPPMAQREYVYARRTWAKPDDGGMYCLQLACPHPSPPAPGCRVVRVDDFASAYVIRRSQAAGSKGHATEIVSVYFENPSCAPGITNMGIKRALWPMMQKSDAALRRYAAKMHAPGTAGGVDATGAVASSLAGMSREAATTASSALPTSSGTRDSKLAAAYHAYLVACALLVRAAQGSVAALASASTIGWQLACLPASLLRSLASPESCAARGRALTAMQAALLPWETLLRRAISDVAVLRASLSAGKAGEEAALPSSASSSSGGASAGGQRKHLASHPIKASPLPAAKPNQPASNACSGTDSPEKLRVSFGGASFSSRAAAPGTSGGGASTASSGGGGTTLRRGLLKRARQLVLRTVKAAGAGLLLAGQPSVSKGRDEKGRGVSGGRSAKVSSS